MTAPAGAGDELPLTIPALLARRRDEAPELDAIVTDDASITYGELDTRTRALAARFVAAGVGRESRVALIMPNGIEELKAVLDFLLSIDIAFPVHLMATYEPLHDAGSHPTINRHVTIEEITEAAGAAEWREMTRVYVR